VVGRVGALISMHQMNLSSYVVQERCIEIGLTCIAIAGIRGGFAALSSRTGCTSGAMADA
jgi:hypothetical protein